MVFFSIIVATLRRPAYANLVQSIRNQTFHDWELLARCEPEVNEYVSRNRGARVAGGEYLVFTDDDCVLPPNYLAAAREDIERGSWPVGLSGPVLIPDSPGVKKKIEQPTWGIGANLVIRRRHFLDHGGFDETWGLLHATKGWRSDTALWWDLEDAYPGRLKYSPRLIVDHIPPMQSQWVPEIEEKLFLKYRKKVMERFVPVDPRLCEFLLQTQDLTPEETRYVVECRRKIRALIPNLPVLPQEKEVIA